MAGSSEFRFVAAACRWPDDTQRQAAIATAASAVRDWDRVLAIGQRHRVMPMLASAIAGCTQAPETQRTQCRTDARERAFRSMREVADALRIARAFDAAGVDWITFKGPVLAQQAYGSVVAKSAHDLDLLIDSDQQEVCFQILRDAGYVRHEFDSRAGQGDADEWSRYFKDSNWLHPRTGHLVELHTRLFNNTALIPDIGLSSPREMVDLGTGSPLPTLGRAELLVYLAVHGALTNWFRIKWLADFAALTRASSEEAVDEACRMGVAMGVGPVMDSSFHLARQLLDCPLPAPIPDALPPRSRAARLAAVALDAMTGDNEVAEPQRNHVDALASEMTGWRLSADPTYRMQEVRRWIANPTGRVTNAVPPWLSFANPAIVVGRFALRRLGLWRSGGA
ncbi:MAG: hypothetical protein CVT77_08010 [Alphaproteobacteria bacterium HGW-Alphaproteobacteria-16]|nr:MAG: hypothetical protein CVT77_08010 [Alphaproteobacteria bacterium HGW-Alphaproteobacteria-16]